MHQAGRMEIDLFVQDNMRLWKSFGVASARRATPPTAWRSSRCTGTIVCSSLATYLTLGAKTMPL